MPCKPDRPRLSKKTSLRRIEERGNVYRATAARNADALQALDRALALEESFPKAHCVRGGTLRALGRMPTPCKPRDRALALRENFLWRIMNAATL